MEKNEFLFGVNSGGPSYTDAAGNEYVKDTYRAGFRGSDSSTFIEIAGTEEDALYQTYTWKKGGFTYEIPLLEGWYFVEMNFAETYSGTSGDGLRVFDVQLEGATVEDDLDIHAQVGAAFAYDVGHFVYVSDGALTLTTTDEVEKPKINAFSIWSVTGAADSAPPTASIATSGAATASQPLTVAITYADETGIDLATIEATDLSVALDGTPFDAAALLVSGPTLSADGTTATATYEILPSGGWSDGQQVSLAVAAGAYADAAGNAGTGTTADYVWTAPDATAPTATIAASGAGTADQPLTVTVTYSDETAIGFASIDAADLSVTLDGAPLDAAALLTAGPTLSADGLTATTVYQILPTGGWSGGQQVSLAVAAGAYADATGNAGTGATADFGYVEPPDTTAPGASISTSGAAFGADPLTVTVVYADETAIDPATIQATDLSVALDGAPLDAAALLTAGPTLSADGTTATTVYEILPSGGWSDGQQVSLAVAAGAYADAAGNAGTGATADATFTADATAPTVAVSTSGAGRSDEPLSITVTWSDETAIDPATIQATDLSVALDGTPVDAAALLIEGPTLSADGRSASALYDLLPSGGWTEGQQVALSVAAGAYADAAGNGGAAGGSNFIYEAPPDTAAPIAAIAVAGATTATEALTVTVTWSDETAIDPATIQATDLSVALDGALLDAAALLTAGPTLSADGLTATATYEILPSGGWSDGQQVSLAVAAGAYADAAGNAGTAAAADFAYVEPASDDPFAGIDPVDAEDPAAVGAVRVTVTAGADVEASTYATDSFVIENLGDKRIAAVHFDLSGALLSDAVFDPVGLAGDTVSRGVYYGTSAGTGAVIHGHTKTAPDVLVPFIGEGGTAGYEGLLLRYDPAVDAGFETGELVTFGVDVDPNSIAGLPQRPTDIDGVEPRLNNWDIGGVSGLELAGAAVSVLFTDGTRATGGLVGDGSSGGSVATLDQASPDEAVSLNVNGVAPGGTGLYGSGESVTVQGPAGATVRVTMVTGFTQPFDHVASDGTFVGIGDRLEAAGDPFGANNALRVQTVDVPLDGSTQDVTPSFDFSAPGGILAFEGDDRLPVAFVAALIDPTTGEPLGPPTAPIHLARETPADTAAPTTAISLSGAETASQALTITVDYADETKLDLATIQVSDLSVTLDGAPLDPSALRVLGPTFSSGGLSARVTYELLPSGGWTDGRTVSLSVAGSAYADESGAVGTGATADFVFAGPADTTAPSASIATSGAGTATEALTVTVTYADETGIDLATIDAADLSVTLDGAPVDAASLLASGPTLAADGLTATATYELLPAGGWTDGQQVALSVAAGAYADAAGNTGTGATADFAWTAPVDAAAPTAAIATAGAGTFSDALTVTVTYADETGIDLATIEAADLSAMLDGAPLDASTLLVSGPTLAADGLTATATYEILPAGGWSEGQTVSVAVAEGAYADLAGNAGSGATADFVWSAPPGGPASLADLTQLALQGVDLQNPTSIDVGADGRLYVSQQNGLIVALSVEKTISNDGGTTTVTWSVTGREDIDLVQRMPNHDDRGVFQPEVVNRQVTGLVATTDANGQVMLYVSSSDPRVDGGGGGGEDNNLDTNSGVLSRLAQVSDGQGGFVWEKVDLVRGFPRSEENHSMNGLQLATDPAGEPVLLATIGGNTNTGAQSNNFAYTPEYFWSGSVVSVDLNALAQLEATEGRKTYDPAGSNPQAYVYDLPTLDDPTRPNDAAGGDLAGDGSAPGDVFGGNDGLNQAIFDPLGIVELFAVGFRNHYDVVVTESGAVYSIDNGSNGGWGSPTVNAQGELLKDDDGDGIADNGPGVNLPNETGFASHGDALHLIDPDILIDDGSLYYAGHPNLYRAHAGEAGIYLFASPGNPWGAPGGTPLDVVDGSLQPVADGTTPVDLGPLVSNLADLTGIDDAGQPLTDPRQALIQPIGGREQGRTDLPNGALYTWFSSTNGIEEYTASNGLQNRLLAVSFDGSIYALTLRADGGVESVESRALTSNPLDLVAQGDDDPYPGVVFVAAYGADQIVILSPDESAGVTPDPNDRDEDGVDDTIDPFAADPDNGMADVLSAGERMEWTFVNGDSFPNERTALFDGTGGLYNGGDIGFTGIMTNRGGLPESLYNQQNIIFGGAPGILQVKSVESGDATTDTQRNGFQLGFTPDADLESFTFRTLIDNYLDEIGGVPADEKLSQGVFLGAGDQNNFVSTSLVRLADGRVGFETVSQFAFAFIGETAPISEFVEVPELATAGSLDTLTIGFDVNVAAGTATPVWTWRLDGAETTGAGGAVSLQGDALSALRGTLTLPDDTGGQVASGLAVGFAASRGGDGGGEVVTAISAGGDETFAATVNGQAVTFTPDATTAGVTIFGNTNVNTNPENTDLANTALDEIYTEYRHAKSNWSDPWGYSFDTGDGTFEVKLFFAETYDLGAVPGFRVFDVMLENQLIADDFDIVTAAGGGDLETTLTATVEVTDGVLDVSFLKEVENAKVDAVLVRRAPTGTFQADWDDIVIEGFGTPLADTIAPSVTIATSGGFVSDDPLDVTVTYEDETELDAATVQLSDFTVSDAVGTEFEILSQSLTIVDARTVTASYSLRPIEGWTREPATLAVAAAAVADATGNLNAAVSETFVYEPPDLVAPSAAIATSGATSADEALTITVVYADETAMDPATIQATDLSVTLDGAPVDAAALLTAGPALSADGTAATATYSLLPTGGWSDGQSVGLSVATGAYADLGGNTGTGATAGFDYVAPPDTTAPAASIATSGAGTADQPLTVTVAYADETGIDLATIDAADLSITLDGAPLDAASLLVSGPTASGDGLTATTTYEILPSGGWIDGQAVSLAVADGAYVDAAGNAGTGATAGFDYEATPSATYETLVRAVNAGGVEFSASDGILYERDFFDAGFRGREDGIDVVGEDDPLYQRYRWAHDGFAYEVPVADGTYRVEMHFAEVYSGAWSAGARVFDLILEDQIVFDDLDVFVESGGAATPMIVEGFAEVTDGFLSIAGSPEVEEPMISAFSIWSDDTLV